MWTAARLSLAPWPGSCVCAQSRAHSCRKHCTETDEQTDRGGESKRTGHIRAAGACGRSWLCSRSNAVSLTLDQN